MTSMHSAQSAHTALIAAGALNIRAPELRASVPGMPMSAGYLLIDNTGSDVDKLLAARADFVQRIEIHATTLVDGVMQMRPLDEPLAIEAGQSVALESGGLHLMLIGLNSSLNAGESATIELQFDNAGWVDVEFHIVDKPGAAHAH